jgi:hypothetical protein
MMSLFMGYSLLTTNPLSDSPIGRLEISGNVTKVKVAIAVERVARHGRILISPMHGAWVVNQTI